VKRIFSKGDKTMLDMKFLRDNLDLVRKKMLERGKEIDLDLFANLDRKRRDILQEVETLRSERNKVSKEIGARKKNKEDAVVLIARMGSVSDRIKELEGDLEKTEEDLRNFMMVIPNIQHESVAYGTGPDDNPVVRHWGEKPKLAFEPQAHWDIGEALNILDFARGAKIAGARFTVLSGAGARLSRALINFFLDVHVEEHGYRELLPPFLVNADSLFGTGQLP